MHRQQLLDLGYTERQITQAQRSGELHRTAESVYAVGHARLSRRGRGVAALLHARPGAALSHESAARVWRLIDHEGDGPIHVTIPDRRGLRVADGTVLHRPRTLTPASVTTHRGLAVTTLPRTIIDLAANTTTPELVRLLEQAVTVHNRSPDELHAWAATVRGVRGRRKLLEALESVVGPAVIRSRLEDEFRLLCAEAGLPMPETNVLLDGWEVDALWRKYWLIIELDSWRFHGGHWQFHRDRRKGLALADAGYEVLRLTWRQVTGDRAVVAQTLARVLQRRARLLGV